MFICWDCYKKNNPKDAAEPLSWWQIMLHSFGVCEVCQKPKECAEVHSHER
jgi:hypothetical protein